MKKLNLKKYLAFIMSVILLMASLPMSVVFASTDATDVEQTFAASLDAVIGETYIDADYSADGATVDGWESFSITSGVSKSSNTSISTGESVAVKGINLRNKNGSYESYYTVPNTNFVAKFTVSHTLSGKYGLIFGTYDNTTEVKSYAQYTYPSASVWYSGENKFRNFGAVENKYFTLGDSYDVEDQTRPITLYIFSYEGTVYYVGSDGVQYFSYTASADKIYLAASYCEVTVSEFSVRELIDVDEAFEASLASSIGATVGETYIDADYSADGATVDGWESSYIKNSVSTSSKTSISTGENVAVKGIHLRELNTKYESYYTVPNTNFVAKFTVSHTKTGEYGLMFGTYDNTTAVTSFAHYTYPSTSVWYSGENKFRNYGAVENKYFTLGDSYDVEDQAKPITLYILSFNGTVYYYGSDGVQYFSYTASADKIYLAASSCEVIVSEFSVRELADKFDSSVQPGIDELELNATVGETLYNLNLGALSVGDTYAAAGLQSGAGSGNNISWSGNGTEAKVVNSFLTDDKGNPVKTFQITSGYHSTIVGTPRLDTKNYVAQVTFYYDNISSSAASPYFRFFNNVKDDSLLSTSGQRAIGPYMYGPTCVDETATSDKFIIVTEESKTVTTHTFSEFLSAPLTDGSKVTITLYSFDGVNHYYMNGKYVGWQSHAYHANDGDIVGFSAYYAGMQITDFVVKELVDTNSPSSATLAVDVADVTVSYADRLGNSNAGAAGMKITASVDTAHKHYAEGAEYGIAVKMGDNSDYGNFTIGATGVAKLALDENNSVEIGALANKMDKFFFYRGYIKSGDTYYYGPVRTYSPVFKADEAYGAVADDIKTKISAVYESSDKFVGANAQEINFSLFSDIHYTNGVHITTLQDAYTILNRGVKNNVDFVVHLGDIHHGAEEPKEFMNALYNDSDYNLNVYGVYGNHELENGTSVSQVTPNLTNDENVVWGTADGKIDENGEYPYYYLDYDKNNDGKNDFRFVFTDNQYSYNPTTKTWEHNKTGSYGPPAGNIYGYSLGDEQIKWLEEVLIDAAEQGLSVVVSGHVSYSNNFHPISGQSAEVRGIYHKANAIRKGTVIASLSGHNHTDNFAVVEDVLYAEINSVRYYWDSSMGADRFTGTGDEMYVDYLAYDDNDVPMNPEVDGTTLRYVTDDQGNKIQAYYTKSKLVNGEYQEYQVPLVDANGNPVWKLQRHISSFSASSSSCYSKDPLNAIVTLNQNGKFVIEGMESEWLAGIQPSESSIKKGACPWISSGVFENGVWTQTSPTE